MRGRSVSDALLALPAVTATAGWLAGLRLRALAYHDVRDQAAFQRHVDLVANHYEPVCEAEVRAALDGHRLPRRAVWITFDDAYPDVVELAMPILDAAGIRATMYVCPSVVDTSTPYWWQVVDAAVSDGLHHHIAGGTPVHSFRAQLKLVPDGDRRRTVAALADLVAEHRGKRLEQRQVTTVMLRQWTDHGHAVGNHTWDHPLLDQCNEAEQRRQVGLADDWIREHAPSSAGTPTFAYPNGNAAPAADLELLRRGYPAPLLFDHRLARLPAPRVSRLRLDAYANERRARAVVSGAHSTAFALAGRLRRG